MTENFLYIIAASSFSMNIEPPALFTDSYLSEEFFEYFRDADYSRLAVIDKKSREYLFYLVYYLRKYYHYTKKAGLCAGLTDKNASSGRMMSLPYETDAREYAKSVTDFVFNIATPSVYDAERFSLGYLISCANNPNTQSNMNRLCDYLTKHRRHVAVIRRTDDISLLAFLYKDDDLAVIKADNPMQKEDVSCGSMGMFYRLLDKKCKVLLCDNSFMDLVLKDTVGRADV